MVWLDPERKCKAACKRRSAARDAVLRDLPLWLEACASCAIEGNAVGKEIIDHWKAGRFTQCIDKIVDLALEMEQ